MKLIITIPAYNEEKTIGRVIKGISQYIEGVDQKEIIVVNDGSTDDTVQVSREAGAFVVSHKEQKGVGTAFQMAVEESLRRKADIMVNIDGDGQFDPLNIPNLIAPLIKGEADMVSGSRFINKDFVPNNMPMIKLLGNKMVSMAVSCLTGKKFYDVTCGFRAYSKEALLNMNLFGKFTYTQETFLDLTFKGFKILEIPIKVQYFPDRISKLTNNLFYYIWQIFKIILRSFRDYRPLKFFGSIGFSIFLLGLGFDIFILVHYLNTGAFSPWQSFAFIGGFLNAVGLGIFILGLLADMLSSIRLNQEKLLYYEKKRRFYQE